MRGVSMKNKNIALPNGRVSNNERDSYFTIVGNFDFKKGINSVKIYECIL